MTGHVSADPSPDAAHRAARDRERAFFNKFSIRFFLLKFSRIPTARFSARLLLLRALCHVDEFCAKLPTLQNGDTAAWPAAWVVAKQETPRERRATAALRACMYDAKILIFFRVVSGAARR